MKNIRHNCVPDKNGKCTGQMAGEQADEPPCRGSLLKRLGYLAAMVFMSLLLMTSIPDAQIQLSISKTNNAPNPIQTRAPFTYTITYSWSGGAPGTLYIIDQVPNTLDVLSALPGSPISNISGNNVVFTLTGLDRKSVV